MYETEFHELIIVLIINIVLNYRLRIVIFTSLKSSLVQTGAIVKIHIIRDNRTNTGKNLVQVGHRGFDPWKCGALIIIQSITRTYSNSNLLFSLA